MISNDSIQSLFVSLYGESVKRSLYSLITNRDLISESQEWIISLPGENEILHSVNLAVSSNETSSTLELILTSCCWMNLICPHKSIGCASLFIKLLQVSSDPDSECCLPHDIFVVCMWGTKSFPNYNECNWPLSKIIELKITLCTRATAT